MQPCQCSIGIFLSPLGFLGLHGQPCLGSLVGPCCHLSPVLAMIYSWDGECCMSPHQSSCSVVEALCVCALQVSQSPAVAIRSSMPMTPAAALNGTHNRDFAIQMAAHHTVCEGSFV